MRRLISSPEIEIKLRVPDASAFRRLLKRINAREIIPRTYESNTLYDTPRNGLRRRGQLIRVRIEVPASGRKRARKESNSPAILTYKGPSRKSAVAKADRRFKIREEAEIAFTGGERIVRILEALGLQPAFQYEKFRTTYQLPGLPNVKVELDETPVGLFLELEGAKSAIDRAARSLGYSESDYLTNSYGTLYLADCRRRGVKPTNMLFQSSKKIR